MKFTETTVEPPDSKYVRKGWRDRVRAYLDAQIEAGATLYGEREDGAYVAYSKEGERVLREPGNHPD